MWEKNQRQGESGAETEDEARRSPKGREEKKTRSHYKQGNFYNKVLPNRQWCMKKADPDEFSPSLWVLPPCLLWPTNCLGIPTLSRQFLSVPGSTLL